MTFNTIEELYEHLENNAQKYEELCEMKGLFLNLPDNKNHGTYKNFEISAWDNIPFGKTYYSSDIFLSQKKVTT